MCNSKRLFNKTSLSVDDQLALLQTRGLQIGDKDKAKQFLSVVGYYRLSAYFKPFQTLQHNFVDNTNFNTIHDLYNFDRKLRLHVMDAIERIEVAFRVALSNSMSYRFSATWYSEVSHFKNTHYHLSFMAKVANVLKGSDKPFIKHYYEQYDGPEYPPSWMIIECLSFGTWSKVFRNLARRQDKKLIADSFKQPILRFESWLQSLTDLRNLCAHHERVWNHHFITPPQDAPQKSHQQRKFYQQAYIIIHLLKVISPDSTWKEHLFELMTLNQALPLPEMGFLKNWPEDSLWEIN